MHLDYLIGNTTTSYHGLIRSYVDEPSTTGVFSTDGSDWKQEELLAYVNMEHRHLFSAVRNLYEDWFGRIHVFPLVANQYRYYLPQDCTNPRRVEFVKAGSVSGSSPNYIVDATTADPAEVQEVEISGKDNLRHYTSSNRVISSSGYTLFDEVMEFLPDSKVGVSYYCRIYYLPTAPDLHRAVAQTGAASTITLGLNAATTTLGKVSSIDNYYKGMYIEIFSGTGEGQIRRITQYDGTTKIATIDPVWTTTPNTTSIYSIVSPIKEDFHELLALGAVIRAKGIKIEDDVSTVGSMYSSLMESMIQSLERRNHQTPRRVITTQRSGVWF